MSQGEEISAILARLGHVRRGRFFGGEAFTLAGRQFAMLMKGTLYLRCNELLARELGRRGSEPFRYATRRGEVRVGAYWTVPPEALEDPDALLAWARRALAALK